MENESRNHLPDGFVSPTVAVAADAGISSPSSSRRSGRAEWPTMDGPLGLSYDESLTYARRFFKWGFFCLPFLWALNCFYFWPVLRRPRSHYRHSGPLLRRYLVGSAIGFLVFTVILTSWALTFSIGGEHLFGNVWGNLVMYNVADRYGLTGWI
ncbi:putative gamma-secretase subunit PEN-2 [Dorcoceras hygrometricum]|uniref:Putative gamma-secretase subunit PEN-2 n=1 Tax=Dorcoceras hygrometricum TaxID=472368 RepID=A0A2Z7CWS8_9LAMI|nr:putative gamma-secretase subunit PEN-2 [Dorcoceras hygrometricum]